MITAKLQGRRLVLTVETEADEAPIEPFYVTPLSARAGRELSRRYLFASEGLDGGEDVDMSQDMIDAFGRENFERADAETTQGEGELLIQAAYFWQSVGGVDSLRALLEVDDDGLQGGATARGKALAAFRLRMVPLLRQIRRSLESAPPTPPATSPDTSSPEAGKLPDEQPSPSSNQQPPTTTDSQPPES